MHSQLGNKEKQVTHEWRSILCMTTAPPKYILVREDLTGSSLSGPCPSALRTQQPTHSPWTCCLAALSSWHQAVLCSGDAALASSLSFFLCFPSPACTSRETCFEFQAWNWLKEHLQLCSPVIVSFKKKNKKVAKPQESTVSGRNTHWVSAPSCRTFKRIAVV